MTTFPKLFDWGHQHLQLGWSDEQVQDDLGELPDKVPGFSELREDLQHTMARIWRSSRRDHHHSASGTCYSRERDFYTCPVEDRHDPLWTHANVTQGIDLMVSHGLYEHTLGKWFGSAVKGNRSVIRLTEKGLDGPAIDPDELPADIKVVTLEMRDSAKKSVRYAHTLDTVQMQGEVDLCSEYLAKQKYRLDGKALIVPPVKRVFSQGSWEKGGQVYHCGTGPQQLPAETRARITDADGNPFGEIDYPNMFIRLAYAHAGKTPPPGDLYDIAGLPREVVKDAINYAFGCTNDTQTVRTVGAKHGLSRRDARTVLKTVKRHHKPIRKYFSGGWGLRLQKMAGDMGVRIMLTMIEETGYCPLPVFDSFLAPHHLMDKLAEVMGRVATEFGLGELSLKDSRNTPVRPSTTHPTPNPFHMEDLSSTPPSEQTDPVTVRARNRTKKHPGGYWGWRDQMDCCHYLGPPAPTKPSKPSRGSATTPSGAPVWSHADLKEVSFRDRVLQALANS